MPTEFEGLSHICGDCNFFSPDISLNLSLGSDLPGDCENPHCLVERTMAGWSPEQAHEQAELKDNYAHDRAKLFCFEPVTRLFGQDFNLLETLRKLEV